MAAENVSIKQDTDDIPHPSSSKTDDVILQPNTYKWLFGQETLTRWFGYVKVSVSRNLSFDFRLYDIFYLFKKLPELDILFFS